MTINHMTTAPAPISHAVKKAARLTAEREKLQHKIDAINLEHAAALVPLRGNIGREKTTISVFELRQSELIENIEQREIRIAELEKRLTEEHAGLAWARADLAKRSATLDDCYEMLRCAQQAYDDRADEPKRRTVALEKKRDNVDRRLRTHLAREPLPALFLGKEKTP